MAEESPPPPGDNDAQPWQGSPKKPKAAAGDEQSAGAKWKVGALPNASPAFGQSSFLGGKPGSGAATGEAPAWLTGAAKASGDAASSSSSAAPAWLSGSSKSPTSSTAGALFGSQTGLGSSKPGGAPAPSWMAKASAGTSPGAGSGASDAKPSWLAAGGAGASFGSTGEGSAGSSWLTSSSSPTGAEAAESGGAAGADGAEADDGGVSPGKRRKYEEVGVNTGEESEKILKKVDRVRLYHFRDGNWSERARECSLHLNASQENGAYKARIVIRTKETKVVVFNASLWPTVSNHAIRHSPFLLAQQALTRFVRVQMECARHGASEKATRISCYNVAESEDGAPPTLGAYLISPVDKEDAVKLRSAIEAAKAKCPPPTVSGEGGGDGASKPEAEAETESAAEAEKGEARAAPEASEGSEAPAKKSKTVDSTDAPEDPPASSSEAGGGTEPPAAAAGDSTPAAGAAVPSGGDSEGGGAAAQEEEEDFDDDL